MSAKRLYIRGLVFASLAAATAHGSPNETISFLDGNELRGFYTFIKDRGRDEDPKRVFQMEDGVLRISGEEWGCITTDKAYDNYRLVVEYTWGGKTYTPREDRARDSGIIVHSTGDDGGYSGTWMHGIECQIIEGGTGDFIVVGDKSEDYSVTCPVSEEMQGSSHVYEQGGKEVTINSGRINWWGRDPGWADTLGYRGRNDIEKPPGEWNIMECAAEGGEIKIYLNGKLVNHCTKARPIAGRIQIQSEGAEILIRKIELQPLNR